MGPVIGAGFARWAQSGDLRSDWFTAPALFALSLALADLVFVILFFKETLPPVSYEYTTMKQSVLCRRGENQTLSVVYYNLHNICLKINFFIGMLKFKRCCHSLIQESSFFFFLMS